MFKRILILFLIFYMLAMLQTSFLQHFFSGKIPNLVLIFLFLIIFFDIFKTSANLKIILAGFFLDLFSNHILGISILIFYAGILIIKKLLKNFERSNFLLFIFSCLIFLLFYDLCISIFDYFINQTSIFPFFSGYTLNYVISNFFLIIFGFLIYICPVEKIGLAFSKKKPKNTTEYIK
ncbi:MAG: hypothetical protein ISS87_00230 [Candidatus Pacebacteria bacterium]|nr:hypothetical protein [Candidatus Paceibacterota bacterium]